ncbi:hypothetical protein Emed_004913 [Eimeria media]
MVLNLVGEAKELTLDRARRVEAAFARALKSWVILNCTFVSRYPRKLRSRGGLGFKSALAVVASAAAVAVLISLCAATYLRAPPLQLTRRRLSEGGSPEPNKGLAACGEASGNGSEDDPQGDLQEEELEAPPAKKAKVEEEGSEEDAEAAFILQTSVRGQEESASAGGATTTAPEAPSPRVLRFSPEEIIAAKGLMALWGGLGFSSQEQAAPGPVSQQQAQLPHAPEQPSPIPSVTEQPAVSATSHALGSLPPLPSEASFREPTMVLTSAAARAETPQSQPASVEPTAPRRERPLKKSRQKSVIRVLWGLRAKLAVNEELEMIDPKREWKPPHPFETGGEGFVEHAFSRLPRVEGGNPSEYSSFFNGQRAVSVTGRPVVQMSALRTLRSMLAQDELSRSQLQQLGMMIEHVVNHLNFHEGRDLGDCPALAAETLGFRFVLLDMTVSSLQLLGVPPRGPWWDQMVSNIPDEYTQPFKGWSRGLSVFNFNLLSSLKSAVRMLKAGHRPAPNVVVHIKRCLFLCRHSPLRFLRPGWDHWREDDKAFYQQFEGMPGRSDPAQPGPSHQSSS